MKLRLLILLLIFIPREAWASSCIVQPPDFLDAYQQAQAVFIGEVLEIANPLTSDKKARLRDRLYKVTLKVEFSWKGAGFRESGLLELVVFSDQGGKCAAWPTFREGRKYLVYATHGSNDVLIVQNEEYEPIWIPNISQHDIISGTRTTLLSEASEDLKELKRMDSPFSALSKLSVPER